MRRICRLLLVALVIPWTVLGVSIERAAAWEIRRFDVDLQVRPDARVRVVETLEVDFGPERRHAICRSLPRFVTDPSGARRSLDLDLIAVTDAAGRPWPVRVERPSRSLDVWMGSTEQFTTGEQVYRLTYEASGAVWRGPYRDELHWDVTGNAWDVLVIAGAARIAWPPGAGADQIEGASRVTRFGRVLREADVKVIDTDHAQFLLNRGLLTFEGLSVSVVWPHGLVRHPGRIDRATAWALRNPALLLVPVVAALLLALRARRRRAAGCPGTTPLATPALTPAAAGFLSRGRLEPAHVAAALLDLERRGVLSITRAPEGGPGAEVAFEAAASPSAELPSFDHRLHALLFPDGARTATLAAFAGRALPAWPVLVREVEASLVGHGDLDPRIASRRSPLLLGALIALVLGLIAGVAGRRAAHGLLGMATAGDWVAVGGASALLALSVVAIGALLPRTTVTGGRRRAAIERYSSTLDAVDAPAGAAAVPFAVALGLGARIPGRAAAPALAFARAVESALGGGDRTGC